MHSRSKIGVAAAVYSDRAKIFSLRAAECGYIVAGGCCTGRHVIHPRTESVFFSVCFSLLLQSWRFCFPLTVSISKIQLKRFYILQSHLVFLLSLTASPSHSASPVSLLLSASFCVFFFTFFFPPNFVFSFFSYLPLALAHLQHHSNITSSALQFSIAAITQQPEDSQYCSNTNTNTKISFHSTYSIIPFVK